MTLTLETNLAELPWSKMSQLSQCLGFNDQWKLLLDSNSGLYKYRPDEVDVFSARPNPAEALLGDFGNRGVKVGEFLAHLHRLSRIHGSIMDRPQCILGRKFVPVRLTSQIKVTDDLINCSLKLIIKADGFPYPQFQWFRDKQKLEGEATNSLRLSTCTTCAGASTLSCSYWCLISNIIEDNQLWSKSYRRNGKQFSSELRTSPVDLSMYESMETCEKCRSEEFGRLDEIKIFNRQQKALLKEKEEEEKEELVASDKVALLISNSEYERLPRLGAPGRDGDTLARLLQLMHFKTLTLADLSLSEMRSAVLQYARMLGAGVYAVFYFAGHGFEANGRSYLLPVDASSDSFGDCLCVDWLLHNVQQHQPALNLVLLDVCRKYLPTNVKEVDTLAEQINLKVNRNTVYGYATSSGVGAYEVAGDANGVFTQYLKKYLTLNEPIVDILNRVLTELELDERAGQVQFPELRTNLSRPRCLSDRLISSGHTTSFDDHTLFWQMMHELPDPVLIVFDELKLRVTVWFDFFGHFTNMVYVFTSISDVTLSEEKSEQQEKLELASHAAFLQFEPNLQTVDTTICTDEEEGESVRMLLKHLQKSPGPINCIVEIREKSTKALRGSKEVSLGHVLITRMCAS